MVRVASLFSGIGGFEKGILQASEKIGIKTEIVFASEIDLYAKKIYKKNYGVEPHGDITQVEASNIPDHDILCGGFPCQAFSIAGLRRGFEDCRGSLFFEIMRIAQVKRPRLLFLENVKGLLSHDSGNTFQTILRSLDDMGYDAEWQCFNSKNHGVPQHRERVFIIGHLRGSCTKKTFPIETSGQVGYAFPNLSSGYRKRRGEDGVFIKIKEEIRFLTPVECERLQGFPDNWTEGISDTQRYKCLGNAVTVNVIQFIAERLLKAE